MHLFSHLFASIRRGALQNFRIVVIQPFESPIAIKRLNSRATPTTEVALAVSVDFDFSG